MMKKKQPRKYSVRRFLEIIQDDSDEQMLAVHEAGHKVMWAICFPEKKVEYVWNVEGYPGVAEVPRRNEPYRLWEMPMEEASRHILVKLAGYAAETINAKISSDEQLEEIVSWLVRDMYAGKDAVIDWKDDYEHGGDIGEVCAALEYLGGKATADLLKKNLLNGFKVAVANLQNEWKVVLEEAENFRVFALTKQQ